MRLDIGTPVRYPDGEQVGMIQKVVFDPQTSEVQDIVLGTPDLVARTVLVPVIMFESGPGGVITFTADRDAFAALPDYEVSEFMDPPDGWTPPENYAPGDSLFPMGVRYSMMPVFEESNAPAGSVEWSQGTEILCTDGRFGTVDEVLTQESGDGSCLSGLVGRADNDEFVRLLIPLNLIADAGSQSIELSCTLDELMQQAEPYTDEGEPEAEPFVPST
ncbi:MAG: PRC-barrel domain-containing protein [Chloroflexia bacterium]